MDWLSGLTPGAFAAGGATLALVGGGISYLLAFQKRFTDRMAEQGDKDVKRIEKLEVRLGATERRGRESEEYVAQLRLQLIEAGMTPVPRPVRDEETSR